MPLNEEVLIERVSIRHSVSTDAVRTILRALRSGGGTMAQFSHSDFGGMSQWSPGMTMVGDMFNNSLKSKLDALCTELAAYVAQAPSEWRLAIEPRGRRQTLGGRAIWDRRVRSGRRMIFSMLFSQALDDWRSRTAAI